MKKLILFCLVSLAFAVFAQAQSDRDKKVFGGFNRLSVSVAALNDDVKSLGLNESKIKTDVEAALKSAGLTVEQNGNQDIYVNIKTIKNDDGSISYTVILYLDQGVILQRDATAKFFGTTWDISAISTTDGANLVKDVREQVLALVDEFVVKYNSVNKSAATTAATPPESDEGSPFTVSKIAPNLPPELYISNKTGRTVYITINGRKYVAAPRTTKKIIVPVGNVTYQARVAGFDAFRARKLFFKQGEGYSLSYTIDK
jgi:hypothetical protein